MSDAARAKALNRWEPQHTPVEAVAFLAGWDAATTESGVRLGVGLAKMDAELLEAAWSVKLPFCEGGVGCRNHGPCRPHAEIASMLAAWTTKHMESLQHEVSILRTTCDAHITVIGDKEDEIKTLREENARLTAVVARYQQKVLDMHASPHMIGTYLAQLLADPEGQRAGEEWRARERAISELADGMKRLRQWLAEAIFHLMRAYEAGHRKGWEPGPSSTETLTLIHAWLSDKGFDPNERHTPQFVGVILSALGGDQTLAAVEKARQP